MNRAHVPGSTEPFEGVSQLPSSAQLLLLMDSESLSLLCLLPAPTPAPHPIPRPGPCLPWSLMLQLHQPTSVPLKCPSSWAPRLLGTSCPQPAVSPSPSPESPTDLCHICTHGCFTHISPSQRGTQLLILPVFRGKAGRRHGCRVSATNA